MSIAEVCSLCKKYPSFELTGVSFELTEGHITGMIGRNGAGKSTTIKSMLNLVHRDSGQVSFFGLPLSENEREIKGRIGFSTGAVNYYPKKKIRDIAAVTSTFYPDWDNESYRKYMKMFSLDESKTPESLSEGMKVKFNLLLALSHRAELLILDEPTAGLDPFSRNELLELFSELKKSGIAILYSTHIISDLEKCADDIIYISGGRLISSCSLKEFREAYGKESENLEDTVLRLEGSKNAY